MKLLLEGQFKTIHKTKTVELNGELVDYLVAEFHTKDGIMLPIISWGSSKKKLISEKLNQDLLIVVDLTSKIRTYANNEGDTVQVANVELKLYSITSFNGGYNKKSQFATLHPTKTEEKVPAWKTSPYNSFVGGSTEIHPWSQNY